MKDIILITLAIGLPDKTWIEREVEVEDSNDLWDGEDTEALGEIAFAAIPEDEKNRLAPSFWKLIHWEMKD